MAGSSHVLARKYRPQVFADLIGQEALVRTITNAIATNRLANAYMLTGIRGIGKTSSARIIAKGLNCVGPDGQGGMTPNPCGVCRHCRDITADAHMDVVEIDAASNTGVDNVREIIEGAKYNPVSARFKIYIIDEVHMLSKSAFNALLKTLEEPPAHVKFIFATTEARKVPLTILSRCQRFDLRRLDEQTLTEHLTRIAEKEGVKAEREALQLLAHAGEGSVRDALSLLDQAMTQLDNALTLTGVRQMLGVAEGGVLFDIYEALMAGDTVKALALVQKQYACGADPLVIVQDLLAMTHAVTYAKVEPNAPADITLSQAECERTKHLAEQLSMASLTGVWQMLLKGVAEIKGTDYPLRALEMLVIRLAYMTELPTPAQLAEEVKKNTDAIASPPLSRPARHTEKPVEKSAPSHAAPAAQEPALTAAPAPAPAPEADVPAPITEPVSAPPAAACLTLAEMIELARGKSERTLAFHLERCVRPVSVEEGCVRCVLTPDAPRTLTGDWTRFLTRETGRPWVIQTQVSGGGQTAEESKKEQQNRLLSELAQEPVVAAVLKTFRGAKIERIRPHEQQEPDSADEETKSPTTTE